MPSAFWVGGLLYSATCTDGVVVERARARASAADCNFSMPQMQSNVIASGVSPCCRSSRYNFTTSFQSRCAEALISNVLYVTSVGITASARIMLNTVCASLISPDFTQAPSAELNIIADFFSQRQSHASSRCSNAR